MHAMAVVFEDRLDVRFRSVQVPDPTDRDVVIDVAHSWISIGTELSYLRGDRLSGEEPRRAGDAWPFPQVAGYQKVGVVRHVGSAVQDLQPGDCVFASVSRVSNLFSDYAGHINPAVTDRDEVWKLPNDTMVKYSGSVLTQVGFNCGMRPPIEPGDVAVVIGDGLVGQWTAQTLLRRGAIVTVLGRHTSRLLLCPSGVETHQITMDDLDEIAASLPYLSVVVDTVGDLVTVQRIQPRLKHDGHIVSAGFLGDQGALDIQRLREQEITVHAPSGWTRPRVSQTLAAIEEGWLATERLITQRFPAYMARDAWREIQENREGTMGVVLDW